MMAICLLTFAPQVGPGLAQTRGIPPPEPPEMAYDQLPSDLRSYVEGIRQICKQADPDPGTISDMQGIDVIDLAVDGAHDIMVDAERLWNHRIAGMNCDNRACELKIWKQTGQQSWKKVFDEDLYKKFISLKDHYRFQLMAVSISADDPRCKTDPRRIITSAQSCDQLVRYKNKAFVWELIK